MTLYVDETGEPGGFEGFVAGGETVRIPAQFFVELLPVLEDGVELRVTLYALFAIGRQAGTRPVRGSALAAAAPLVRALAAAGGGEAIAPALDRAVGRGALLACPLDDGDTAYLANNEAGRRAMERVRSGAAQVPGARVLPARPARPASTAAQAYEQEIGLVTPSVAEALAAAGERYPEGWVAAALRAAARHNARSWAYAEAILRRWEREGPDLEGTDARDGDRDADATVGRGAAGAPRRDHGPFERVVRRGRE